MSEEYKPFTRADLVTWAPDGERQAQAWNRLRRVCIELRLKVPTLMQVRDMEADLSGEAYQLAKQRWSGAGEMFDEEFSSVLVLDDESGKMVLAQFDAGYVFE